MAPHGRDPVLGAVCGRSAPLADRRPPRAAFRNGLVPNRKRRRRPPGRPGGRRCYSVDSPPGRGLACGRAGPGAAPAERAGDDARAERSAHGGGRGGGRRARPTRPPGGPPRRDGDLPVHRPGGQHPPAGRPTRPPTGRPCAGTTPCSGAAVEAHGGAVFETVGDAVYAAFARPTDAVARRPWPGSWPCGGRPGGAGTGAAAGADGAAHWGRWSAEGGAHYFGAPLYRCARLMATAHGGQVVLSEATAALVRDALPAGAALRDLGAHRLKDLQRPERVFQLLHPDLPGDFPPLRSLDALPAQPPGAAHALRRPGGASWRRCAERLLRPDVRLLTLTGPAGWARPAWPLQAAAEAAGRRSRTGRGSSTWRRLADPALVPAAVAQALGVREAAGGPAAERAAGRTCGTKRLLLVLDNCEHLLRAAPAVGGAAGGLPAADGRWRPAGRRCASPGSTSTPVPAAGGCPESRPAPDPTRRRWPQYEAVAPVRRAGAWPSGRTSPSPTRTRRRWRRSAAGWTGCRWPSSWRPPGSRCSRPRRCWPARATGSRLLTGGARDLPARQQTLRAHARLELRPARRRRSRRCSRRLAVFAGGCTLEAARGGLRGGATGAAAGRPDVGLDGLASLVDKSLRAGGPDGPRPGEPRFAMLETVREYALERLAGQRARRRPSGGAHAAYFLALARAGRAASSRGAAAGGLAGPAGGGARQPARGAALVPCERARGGDRACASPAAPGAASGGPRGYRARAARWLAAALAGRAPAPAGGAGEGAAGAPVTWRGCRATAPPRALYEEELAVARRLGDTAATARALLNAGIVARSRGDFRQATGHFEESLRLSRALADPAAWPAPPPTWASWRSCKATTRRRPGATRTPSVWPASWATPAGWPACWPTSGSCSETTRGPGASSRRA